MSKVSDRTNPNDIRVGDTIYVEQAWKDTTGAYHDEYAFFAIVFILLYATGSGGAAVTSRSTLDFGRKDLND